MQHTAQYHTHTHNMRHKGCNADLGAHGFTRKAAAATTTTTTDNDDDDDDAGGSGDAATGVGGGARHKAQFRTKTEGRNCAANGAKGLR